MSETPTAQVKRPSLNCVLIYEPHDGERQEFPFDPFLLRSVEAEAVEELGPWDTYAEWGQKLLVGHRRAARALLWVMLRRTKPDLDFDDVSVIVDELRLFFPEDEAGEPEGKDEPADADTDSS